MITRIQELEEKQKEQNFEYKAIGLTYSFSHALMLDRYNKEINKLKELANRKHFDSIIK